MPYLLFTVLVGFPLVLMEIALGQYTSHGAVGCWEMTPAAKGEHPIENSIFGKRKEHRCSF